MSVALRPQTNSDCLCFQSWRDSPHSAGASAAHQRLTKVLTGGIMSRTQVRAPSHFVDAINESTRRGTDAGILMQRTTQASYRGQHVDIAGHTMCNFGGCSYLGLEQREELREAAIDAIRRFGTQFSFSRAYLECPLYRELEDLLGTMTGGHATI